MAHKYLKDLGYKDTDLTWNWLKGDARQEAWKEERKKFGFDERDTWNLNFTLTLLTYERLKHYRNIGAVEMDVEGHSHTYEIDGVQQPYGAIIDRILAGFEKYLDKTKDIRFEEEDYKEYQKCWELLGIIMPSLWW